MKPATLLLIVGSLSLVLGSSAWAEIYETRDAQGNPVFSDAPDDVGDAEVVDLQQTNIADAPRSDTERDAESAGANKGGKVTVIPNSRNEEIQRGEAEQRLDEVGDDVVDDAYNYADDDVRAVRRAEPVERAATVDERANAEGGEHRQGQGGAEAHDRQEYGSGREAGHGAGRR